MRKSKQDFSFLNAAAPVKFISLDGVCFADSLQAARRRSSLIETPPGEASAWLQFSNLHLSANCPPLRGMHLSGRCSVCSS
jgi:hypothetical protein